MRLFVAVDLDEKIKEELAVHDIPHATIAPQANRILGSLT